MIIKHIENKAVAILNQLNIKKAADIDISAIAKHLQVDSQPANIAGDIAGIFVIKESKPYIRYNENNGVFAVRFIIAHELGHFILHKDIPLFICKNIKIRKNEIPYVREIFKEKEANAFAYALLMPQTLSCKR